MKSKEWLQRHSLVAGIFLMFLLTWPIDLANSGVLPFRVPFAIYITLGWGFIWASLIMTGLTSGRQGVAGLVKRFLIWRVRWTWYAVALLLFPVAALAAVLLAAAADGTAPDFGAVFARQIFGPSAPLAFYVVPYLLFDALTNGEEMGWRGYVLPRLQARYNALASSLILGVIWALWHLPKFLAPGNTSPFGWFAVQIVIEAILYTWLYTGTGGSLLLVTLFHAAGNTAGVFLPLTTTIGGTNLTALLAQTALELVVALVVIARAGPAALARVQPKQVQA
jgi:membrane protease YdiL (CAAX protease family)